jgi:hypothetical protein
MNELQSSPIARKWLKSAWPLAVAMILLLSCSVFSSPATNTPAPTNTPVPTDTQVPTDTPEPTATKKPTPNKAATQAAQQEADQQATDAAATEIVGQVLSTISSTLDAVGQPMGSGTVLYWNPSPVVVESSQPNVLTHQPVDPNYDVQGANFAFHSSITWETKQKVGIVYCAFLYRISGDMNMDPWYMMRMGRISGLGHILFDVMQGWTIIGEAGDISNYIRDENGATNDVLLVARANQFTAYVNGKQASVWWNTKIDKGGFGFGTMQDTGSSVCTFADNWIWGYE